MRRQPGLLARLIPPLCEVEVPLGPEDELELDELLRLTREGAQRGGMSLTPLYALSFWFMKRRAGQVGERLGRELLAPAFAALGGQAPRLHLIGHSFGAKLVSSAVLGGLRPASLVLLQAAFSAYAFAEEVPGPKRPGYYRSVITERMVADRIVALRSDHDRALTRLYPAATWGDQVDRAPGRGRRRPVREVVARRAMGAVGALGAGATEMDLVTVQKTGLPRGVTTIDGSSGRQGRVAHRRPPRHLPRRDRDARARWRARVVAYGRVAPKPTVLAPALAAGVEGTKAKSGSRAWSWAALMHRAFAVDVLACPHCGGRLRLIATLHDPAVIRKLLAHLGMARSGPSPGPAPPES